MVYSSFSIFLHSGISQLSGYLADSSPWMTTLHLKLKTEVLFGPKAILAKISPSLQTAQSSLPHWKPRAFGIIRDEDLAHAPVYKPWLFCPVKTLVIEDPKYIHSNVFWIEKWLPLNSLMWIWIELAISHRNWNDRNSNLKKFKTNFVQHFGKSIHN